MTDGADTSAGTQPVGESTTESAKAAKKRRRREPPPDPTPLYGLIDAHTHLAACGGRSPETVRAIVDHAESVGVEMIVTVADDMVDARWAVSAADWDDRVYAAVALHPMHAGDLDDATSRELEQMAQHPRVVAVGETGLDYYWPCLLYTSPSPRDATLSRMPSSA